MCKCISIEPTYSLAIIILLIAFFLTAYELRGIYWSSKYFQFGEHFWHFCYCCCCIGSITTRFWMKFFALCTRIGSIVNYSRTCCNQTHSRRFYCQSNLLTVNTRFRRRGKARSLLQRQLFISRFFPLNSQKQQQLQKETNAIPTQNVCEICWMLNRWQMNCIVYDLQFFLSISWSV